MTSVGKGGEDAKQKKLVKVLSESAADAWLRDGSTLVFCKDLHAVETVAALLAGSMPELNPGLLHEELKEDDRAAVLAKFRVVCGGSRGDDSEEGDERRDGAESARLLVCTSLAARGLDFPNLRHVVLYDVPKDITAFVHSAGRTARRGKIGLVTCLVRNAHDVGRYKHLHALQDAPKLHFAQAAAGVNAGDGGAGAGGTDAVGGGAGDEFGPAAEAPGAQATPGDDGSGDESVSGNETVSDDAKGKKADPKKKAGNDAAILSFFGI